MELIHLSVLTHCLPLSSQPPSPTAFPGPLPPPVARSHGFHHASGTIQPSDYWQRIARHFALAYRSAYSGATRRRCQSSSGHAMFFRTVLSANTLVRWVNENAFAPIVRARPCPTFGRPVHHRGGPRRLRPGTSPHTLRIPPHGGHPVLRSNAESGFRFTLAVSSFRLRARLGFSIPSLFSGQRGVNPAFGYSAPHPGAGGTSTLLNNALLSAHYGLG
jgi:hypothetical protein